MGSRRFISSVAASLACLAVLIAPARAQKADLQSELRGAEGCAEAKTRAMARRGVDRPRRSLASPNIDVTWYSLDIDLDFDSQRVSGDVTVEARVVGSPLQQLVLDLADSMTVSDVLLGGVQSLSFTHAGGALSIALPASVPVDSIVSVEVVYSGTPEETGFGAFVFGEWSGQPVAWSLSEPYGAREWWPCKDHPSDKADSVRVAITVPDSMMAGSQGVLRSTTSALGRTTYEWASNYPTTSYLVSVAAGVYVHYVDSYVRPPALASEFGALTLPLEHFVYDDATPELPDGWARVNDAFEVLEPWYGPYPFPQEKYGHAQFTFGGGMEHQTLSSIGSSATSIVVHELAHQWFGDAISPRSWPHLWLNEGFATHAELLYFEARPDSPFVGLHDVLVSTRRRTARWAEGTLLLTDTSSVSAMFDGANVYAKGAMVLRMLRSVAGDSTFGEILRAYASDPAARYGNATTDDFQKIAEAVYGSSLDQFFRQWVTEGTGYPVYRMEADSSFSDGSWRVQVTLEQMQRSPESNVSVFEMPVTIAVETSAGEERFTVQNNRRWQVFALQVAAQPSRVVFDPDGWLLRNEDVDASPQRPPGFPRFETVYPNPTRSVATLRFHSPVAGRVIFVVYDVAGRRVGEIARVTVPAGPNEVTVNTQNLPSGVYFVRLEHSAWSSFEWDRDLARRTLVRKMVVLR